MIRKDSIPNPLHFPDEQTIQIPQVRQQDPSTLIPSTYLTTTKYNRKRLTEVKWDKDNKVGRTTGRKRMNGKFQELLNNCCVAGIEV